MTLQTIAELFDLTGKGAVVTGGGMGLGQAIAYRLAEAGASVMVADINLEAAHQTVEQIKESGCKAKAIRADIRNTTDAKAVFQATEQTYGSLDILVNNAGVSTLVPILEITEETWDKTLDINLRGVFFYSQVAARQMIEAGHGGKIINIASIDAFRPHGETAHYSASKGGVVMVTKALALELAPQRILVNAVAPGSIITPNTIAIGEALAARGIDMQEYAAKMVDRFPLGGSGMPDDVANVVLFLASAAADYMTGSVVLVDGGQLLS